MRPLQLPSLRRLLIQLNLDMNDISQYVSMCRSGNHTTFHTMVLLLEDRRFNRHFGIDYLSFVRDAWRLITFRRHGGFSTIEMQFVRTVTRRYERTMGRKFHEMLLAHLCNWHFTKTDILNSYLSIAYYGYFYPVRGLYGIVSNFESVASDVFGKPVDALSLEESAEMASYLVYPRPAIPTEAWSRRTLRRRNYALFLYTRHKKLLK